MLRKNKKFLLSSVSALTVLTLISTQMLYCFNKSAKVYALDSTTLENSIISEAGIANFSPMHDGYTFDTHGYLQFNDDNSQITALNTPGTKKAKFLSSGEFNITSNSYVTATNSTFGNDYDNNTEFTINSAADLAKFSDMVNGFILKLKKTFRIKPLNLEKILIFPALFPHMYANMTVMKTINLRFPVL